MLQVDLRRRDGARRRRIISAALKLFDADAGEADKFLRNSPSLMNAGQPEGLLRGVCEVFASLGNAGGCPSQSEATCRVVSAHLFYSYGDHFLSAR